MLLELCLHRNGCGHCEIVKFRERSFRLLSPANSLSIGRVSVPPDRAQAATSARAHNNLGQIFLKTGRLPEAIQHFRAALEIGPEHFPVIPTLAPRC